MSTLTEQRADSIEHLDHEPECGTGFHAGPPRAHFWIRHHECEECLICMNCLKRLRAKWDRDITIMGKTRCRKCGKLASKFEDAYQVMPL
ncbi:hypothetical protein [Nocardia asiatica]|uniref:hypothetical protein n=1 Tax=Nocardia asiatica TaxID=209252 RepID=UPI0024563A1E|nr:hypothetical protein [Nocardia asiatica]